MQNIEDAARHRECGIALENPPETPCELVRMTNGVSLVR